MTPLAGLPSASPTELSRPSPKPIERPDIVVPDAGSLLRLAQAGALGLLHQVGGRVVLADLVAFEATRDLTTPGAVRVRDWIAVGNAPESTAPVTVEVTDIGRLFALARQADPDVRIRGAGERAVVDWLAETVRDAGRAMMVICENGRVPRIIANQGIGADVDLMTAAAFLTLTTKQGKQDSCE